MIPVADLDLMFLFILNQKRSCINGQNCCCINGSCET